jgi:cell division septal protein FtsQ
VTDGGAQRSGGAERDPDGANGERSSPGLRRFKLALAGIGLLLLAASPFWSPLLLRRMAFFHVRRVEILGAHYVAPSDILARLHVDTTSSVWDPTAPLVARVLRHPAVKTAAIRRQLPGTLIIDITERVPIALVSASGGLRVYDALGIALPIDPASVSVDAPVLMARDTALLRFLGALRTERPALYARVSTIRRVGRDELILQMNSEPVRAMHDITVERLAELEPVEMDLARKQLRVAEIDLRYRDQVIARVQ